MKKLSHVTTIILTLTFLLGTVILPVSAETMSPAQEPCDSIEAMYNEAKSANQIATNTVASVKDAAGNVISTVEVYKAEPEFAPVLTLQNLLTETTPVVETYVAVASILPGSNTLGNQDGTSNVYGTLTIYYNLKVEGTSSWHLLTSVSGGYSLSGQEGVVVHTQDVVYGCSSLGIGNYRTQRYPGTSRSWSYNTGYTQYAATWEQPSVGAGVKYTCRRGSTDPSTFWYFTINNVISGTSSFV